MFMTAYLDHAATTSLRAAAAEAMKQAFAVSGNPSSLHTAGRHARRDLEESREHIASHLGAAPSEVLFTAGGTESDNQALKGLYWKRREEDSRRHRVVVSAVEHHAVMDPAVWLQDAQGASVDVVPVDQSGRVDLAALRELLEREPETVALVSVMWANNEVGTIQPIHDIAALASEFDIPVHADAVQAAGLLEIDFGRSGLAAMSISAHKVGGPVGTGALLVRRGTTMTPLTHGGGQERGIRSGTLDHVSAAGFAAALGEAVEHAPTERIRLAQLRDRFVNGVLKEVPDAFLSGTLLESADRLPGIAHFTFAQCEGDSLLYLLDAQGVYCSNGSACQAGVPQASHVLHAMGIPDNRIRGALRFSLGHNSTDNDIDSALAVIGPVVERARTAGLAMAAMKVRSR